MNQIYLDPLPPQKKNTKEKATTCKKKITASNIFGRGCQRRPHNDYQIVVVNKKRTDKVEK